MFVDTAKIYVRGGKGGDGCNSWVRNRRGKKVPDGGSGGKGGDVLIQADSNLTTLIDFRYQQHYSASKGGPGGNNYKQGRRGDDCLIRVPPGTTVFDAQTNYLLRDLTTPGDSVIVAYGGKGGCGNLNRPSEEGKAGEERELRLELKLIADVGIVGYPNSGKSTLISKISSALPKIADYPFTTLRPVLGVIKGKKTRQGGYRRDIIVCEIPGLIKDAHRGKGLGTFFLRHIERTKFLIHLIDLSQVNKKEPLSHFNCLNRELELYNKNLLKKKQIIVVNKIDIPEARKDLPLFKSKIKRKVYPISALTGEGVKELVKVLDILMSMPDYND